ALVEQAAAAAESLQDQAASLAQAVSVFKLGSETQAVLGLRLRAPAANMPAPARAVPRRTAIAPKAAAKSGSKPAGADGDQWEEF
ncbi:MAG: hypothetical protein Q8Q81_07190, partial [Oxalobacteraceae bacterium]|nr:hypothetical protein [Oxalobacteraceae bacterium]